VEDDLMNLNTKLRMIYDVVKTDPNYMRYSFKSSANAVQAMMKDQASYNNFKNIVDEDDEDDMN
jgi:hypothetical protein